MDNTLTEKWRIIRQDSNGNRFIEEKDLDEADADRFVTAREQQIGAHHQSVWKQPMREAAPYPFLHVVLKPGS